MRERGRPLHPGVPGRPGRTSRKAAAERAPLLELTYNWDPEKYGEGRNFGHLAFEVDDIYATCDRLMKAGVTINRPPRDGRMAFVRSPDNISHRAAAEGRGTAQAGAVGVDAEHRQVVTRTGCRWRSRRSPTNCLKIWPASGSAS